MTRRRRTLTALGLAAVLMLLAWPPAGAEYRGSDLLGNIGPESQVAGSLADRYPLSAYALDYHVDVGVTDPEGVPPMIAQWAAAQLWNATSLLVKCTIDLFTWAFSLDLLTGPSGALAPVGSAITALYENVIGEAWMVVAILIAGIWAIWKALVQRRYTETAGALVASVVFVVIALFFVYQPERTVGQAARWTNQLSVAFLSGANRGSLENPDQAKRQVADHLFQTLVVQPWAVLEFGGLRHCVDTDRPDQEGFPRPVGPHDPTRDVCRDHLEAGRDGYGGYGPRFLRQRPGSEERKAEYDALREGQTPALDRQFAGYRVDKADAPAVDAQQAGGAFQRLTIAALLLIGALGAVALLGFLSLAVILAQVVALVLLGFAPIALVIGIFPGAGHAFFRAWLSKLATAVFIKALYSLVIAIVVAVSAALTAATGTLGFLFAFGLQTIFFWAIFIYRKQIANRLVSATTGAVDSTGMPRMTVVQRGATAAAKPFTAIAAVGRAGTKRQISVLTANATSKQTDKTQTTTTASETRSRSSSRSSQQQQRDKRTPDAPNPAEHGRGRFKRSAAPGTVNPSDHALTDPAQRADVGNAERPAGAETSRLTGRTPTAASAQESQATPRAMHEDVMRRARELRDRQRNTPPSEPGRD